MGNRALFTGTFDPPSLGHLDLIERAAALVDQLIVGVAALNHKPSPLFSLDERIDLLQEMTGDLSNVEVVVVDRLAVDVAMEKKVNLLIRGIRGPSDLDDELRMAAANRKLSGIETLLLPASPETSQISSTLIREIGTCNRDLSGFVPASIAERVRLILAK